MSGLILTKPFYVSEVNLKEVMHKVEKGSDSFIFFISFPLFGNTL